MKIRFLILALLLMPVACHVCVGQANISGSGVTNNACCSVNGFVSVANDSKGVTVQNSQNPPIIASQSPVSSVTPSPVPTHSIIPS